MHRFLNHASAVLAVCVFLTTLSGPLKGDTIIVPPFNFSATSAYGTNTTIIGNYKDVNPNGGAATGTSEIRATTAPSPILSVIAQSGGDSFNTFDARALLTYYVMVEGPVNTIGHLEVTTSGSVGAVAPVPGFNQGVFVLADAKISIPGLVSPTNPNGLSLETLINFTAGGQTSDHPPTSSVIPPGSGTNAGGFHGQFFNPSLGGNVMTNVPFLVVVSVRASGSFSGKLGGSAFATVDPVFTLDPADASSGLFTILVSPGIGNTAVSSTPEPATFGLIPLGLALVAVIHRRRR